MRTMCRQATFDLPSHPENVRAARQVVSAHARSWGIGEEAGTVLGLLTSELVTNAVRFSHDLVKVVLHLHHGLIEVSVRDPAQDRPTSVPASVEADSGRGMAIVDALSQDWGVRPQPVGKAVWSRLAVDLPLSQEGCPCEGCTCEDDRS